MPLLPVRGRGRDVTLVLACAAAACGEGPAAVPIVAITTLAPAEAAVFSPVTVEARVMRGAGAAEGLELTWEVLALFDCPPCSLAEVTTPEPRTGVTDREGRARTTARLPTPGPYRIVARVEGAGMDTAAVTALARTDLVPSLKVAEVSNIRAPGDGFDDPLFAAAAAVDGEVIRLLGGACQEILSSCWSYAAGYRPLAYDPATDAWSAFSAAPGDAVEMIGGGSGPVAPLAATLSDGLHYLRGRGSTHHLYDAATDSWHARAAPPEPPTPGSLEAVDDRLYLMAGGTALWAYDAAADAWSERASRPMAGAGTSAVLDGAIYLAVGSAGRGEPSFARYDPGGDAWSSLGDLPHRARGAAAVAVDGRICLAGGGLVGYRYSRNLPEVYCYDPDAREWSLAAILPQAAVMFMADAGVDDAAFLFGGGSLGYRYWYQSSLVLRVSGL